MSLHTVDGAARAVNQFVPLTIKSAVAVVHLSRGKYAIIEAPDAERACRFTWSALASHTGTFYAHRRRSKDNRHRSLHHFIVDAAANQVVDHKDGNPLNNRRSNLRIATRQQNGWNRAPDRRSKTGFKGVHFFKPMQKWQAHIRVNDRKIHLGYYPDAESAARAYDEAAHKHFGEFARPNFPGASLAR